jgi:SAM-dependent methyltransferase
VPIAQETGKKIIGIDRSPAMLALAKEKAADAGVELELHEGDMRDFALDDPAALVYCPFRALLHLPTWSDKRQVFDRVAAALAPGGRFVWNSFVFNTRIAAENDGKWEVQHGIRHRVDHSPGDNRLDITLESGGSVSLWWVTKSEWEGLVDVSRLEVEALYGDFERAPFDEQSGEFVWVARKPR